MATSLIGDSFAVGTKNVTTAGTALQLETSTERRVRSVQLQAHDDNTGRIYFGGSDVASTTQRGLAPGESKTITADKPFSLDEIYIDCSVNGEGVDFEATLA